MEGVTAVVELVLEVFVSGGVGRRDDGDATDESRERQELLRFEQTVRLQLSDRALPLTGYVAEGIGGIDANDREADTIDGVPLDLHLHEHRHAGLEALPGLGFEIRHEQFFIACPTGSAHLGSLTVHEIEVHMSAFLAEAVHFGFDPVRRRQTGVQRFAYLIAKFRKSVTNHKSSMVKW